MAGKKYLSKFYSVFGYTVININTQISSVETFLNQKSLFSYKAKVFLCRGSVIIMIPFEQIKLTTVRN